jgi:hypothetical protein
LWNINCRDWRFHVDRVRFEGMDRLSLYFCGCGAAFYYRAPGGGKVKILSDQEGSGDARKSRRRPLPYRGYPRFLVRRSIDVAAMLPLKLRPIWRKFDRADSDERVSAAEKRVITEWIGHPIEWGLDRWRHQLGGLPWLLQGRERIPCPNAACSRGRRRRAMQVLAAIHNDPEGGLPLVEPQSKKKRVTCGDIRHSYNHWVQVVYHICPECLTLHVASRCD